MFGDTFCKLYDWRSFDKLSHAFFFLNSTLTHTVKQMSAKVIIQKGSKLKETDRSISWHLLLSISSESSIRETETMLVKHIWKNFTFWMYCLYSYTIWERQRKRGTKTETDREIEGKTDIQTETRHIHTDFFKHGPWKHKT